MQREKLRFENVQKKKCSEKKFEKFSVLILLDPRCSRNLITMIILFFVEHDADVASWLNK